MDQDSLPNESSHGCGDFVDHFVQMVTRIDRAVFLHLDRPLTPTLHNEFHPEDGGGLYLAMNLVTYGLFPHYLEKGSFALVQPPREEYRIWAKEVVVFAMRSLSHNINCVGDADVKKLLTVFALAVVRQRVLKNRYLFKSVHLRTVRRVIKYENIPLDWKRKIIKERARLSMEGDCTPCKVDLELLLFLIELEAGTGKSFEETLHFLTNS